jgi:hypothetical protein
VFKCSFCGNEDSNPVNFHLVNYGFVFDRNGLFCESCYQEFMRLNSELVKKIYQPERLNDLTSKEDAKVWPHR